jgi:hypothetical protein
MPDYTKFDRRVNSIVAELRTEWSPDVPDLPADRRGKIARWLHAHADQAAKVAYDRTPTGFCRTITVTAEDVERAAESRAPGEIRPGAPGPT